MKSVLKLDKIFVTLGAGAILENVALSLEREKITTLIGPNGAGKSTLVRVVLGLLKPSSGTRWISENVRMGYMPQKITISQNLPITVRRFLQFADQNNGVVDEVLSKTKTSEVANTPLQNISGGEFQRVLLARALLRKPSLLVLDEPVQGVDINGQVELYQLISTIRNQIGCSVLMVSHDLHLVMAETDEVICLNRHICCKGHPQTVVKHPAYQKMFGQNLSGFALYTHHHDHIHSLNGKVLKNTPSQNAPDNSLHGS